MLRLSATINLDLPCYSAVDPLAQCPSIVAGQLREKPQSNILVGKPRYGKGTNDASSEASAKPENA